MKPCCGYPSVTAAVLALQAKGLRSKEISLKIGKSQSHVINVARDSGSPFPKSGNGLKALEAACVPLQPYAKKRGLPAVFLAARVLRIAAKEGLIDAILDDETSS